MKNRTFIPAFIINSNNSTYGTETVLDEFLGKEEFLVNIVPPVIDENNVISLPKTIQHIIRKVMVTDIDCVLICQDDHRFTDSYSKNNLFECISQAKELGADILCGGLGIFRSALRVSKHIFWVEDFAGLPFTIIFRSFFEPILTSDYEIFPFSNGKFFIYPFISLKKEPVRDNASPINTEISRTENERGWASAQVEILDNISAFYKEFSGQKQGDFNEDEFDDVAIPTYIINLPERPERLDHIKKQFVGKDEFNVQIIEACRNPIGAVGLWESIRKIVKIAMDNEDDVIIICEDDHQFTADYSKSLLLKNILEANEQHTEMISGGICEFHKALPVTANRAWVSTSFCTQFIILYKPVFNKILDTPYDDTVTADAMLSTIVSNKMVFFPFISAQKPFGYSDVTKGNHENIELFARSFYRENTRLKRIYEARATYSSLQMY
ncbi:hypothetical protein [Mucilaginibacter sp.]|uniref:hypothetical protein n=1 Tax=Mucilaginibacter sp. TaxID=1882438 RepID=UPI002ED372BF